MKPEERKVARRLRAEGASVREIAATVGVSLSTASVWTRDVPLPVAAPSEPTPASDEPLRRCARCRRALPVSAFNAHPSGRQWWCCECFGQYYREDAERHRTRANALKRAGGGPRVRPRAPRCRDRVLRNPLREVSSSPDGRRQ